jgi:hypothetical protein
VIFAVTVMLACAGAAAVGTSVSLILGPGAGTVAACAAGGGLWGFIVNRFRRRLERGHR